MGKPVQDACWQVGQDSVTGAAPTPLPPPRDPLHASQRGSLFCHWGAGRGPLLLLEQADKHTCWVASHVPCPASWASVSPMSTRVGTRSWAPGAAKAFMAWASWTTQSGVGWRQDPPPLALTPGMAGGFGVPGGTGMGRDMWPWAGRGLANTAL